MKFSYLLPSGEVPDCSSFPVQCSCRAVGKCKPCSTLDIVSAACITLLAGGSLVVVLV